VAGERHGHGWSSGVPALLCQECGRKQGRVKVEEGTMMVCQSDWLVLLTLIRNN
jgi:hypothetical protein